MKVSVKFQLHYSLRYSCMTLVFLFKRYKMSEVPTSIQKPFYMALLLCIMSQLHIWGNSNIEIIKCNTISTTSAWPITSLVKFSIRWVLGWACPSWPSAFQVSNCHQTALSFVMLIYLVYTKLQLFFYYFFFFWQWLSSHL